MKQKGYTLVEMMVVVALLSVVGVAVVAMFLTTSRGGGKAGAVALVKQEADYAITTMERYIHFAKAVDTCTSTPGNTIKVTDLDGEDVTFTLSGTQITRQINTEPASSITSSKVQVNSLEFTCINDGGVMTVDVEFEMQNVGGLVTNTFHTKAVLRNRVR